MAFTFVLLALRDRASVEYVAVAATPIEVGTHVGADQIEFRAVNVEDGELFDAFIDRPGAQVLLDQYAVATRSIEPGSAIGVADLVAERHAEGALHTMSFEISAARAAGGGISAGDSVTLISVVDAAAEVVASGLEVVGVATQASLGGNGFWVTVRVDPPTALRLAAAVTNTDIFLLRSTGATPFEVDRA